MDQNQGPATRRLEIKKYANRRYYDSIQSRHLTLEEIRELVQQGHDLHVTDAKTGSDISAQVLMQIILEFETRKLDLVPQPLLVWLLRLNDESVKSFIETYFKPALKPFFDYQEQSQPQAGTTHGLPAPATVIADWAREIVTPFAAAFRPPVEKKETQPRPPAGPGHSNEDLGELISQMDQIKAETSKKSRKKE